MIYEGKAKERYFNRKFDQSLPEKMLVCNASWSRQSGRDLALSDLHYSAYLISCFDQIIWVTHVDFSEK